jgi:hypothetical protein
MTFGKSVLVTMEVTVAGSSHNCRFNSEHRIKRGESRLTITEDRSKLNYCLPCAKKFWRRGSCASRSYRKTWIAFSVNERSPSAKRSSYRPEPTGTPSAG